MAARLLRQANLEINETPTESLADDRMPRTTESDLPSLPTALQDQLGLRLESQNAPIETLLIDSAARPDPN